MADAAAIAKEILSRLRGYEGLTALKLSNCPALLEALGTTDPQQARARFVQAIERLPEDQYTDALKCALRLDSTLPASLTGRSGRRAAYGLARSVSEETVKSWEARAIETLAQSFTAQTVERIEKMVITFVLADKKLLYKTETRVWVGESSPSPGASASIVTSRAQTRKTENRSPRMYLLQAGEHPAVLEVCLVFPGAERPPLTLTVDTADIFEVTTLSYGAESLLTEKRRPVSDLLVHDPDTAEQLPGYVGHRARFDRPEHYRVYGIAWTYPKPSAKGIDWWLKQR